MNNPVEFAFLSSINQLDRETWETLCGREYPFLRYDFLALLEQTGCANTNSGWQPHHLVIKQNHTTIGVMPLFIKHHSYGEYVFDWSWADAYHRHGLNYYPKLLTAIPYTPATGPRLCLNTGVNEENLLPLLIDAIKKESEKLGTSSWHCLFPPTTLHQQLAAQGISAREGCQFHWLNDGYDSFDDFLGSFVSRKRKSLKKERRRIDEQGITIAIKTGADISEQAWEQFYLYYHLTYYKRSGRQGYLNKDFFLGIGAALAEHIVMVQAFYNGSMIAAALCFKGGDTLYGRYWGCEKEFDMLHFECCYYRGIDYAIEQKLRRFDPGAQGEHKIQRGFTPVTTYSNHWIAQADFRHAIDDFLTKERVSNQYYIEDASTYLPFKCNDA